MIQSVEGIFRNGKIELLETPQVVGDARVIVTFLSSSAVQEGDPVCTPEEEAELRGKLAAWEADWNAPGMEAYNDYKARRGEL